MTALQTVQNVRELGPGCGGCCSSTTAYASGVLIIICLRKDYKVVVAVVIQRELDKSHKSFEMVFLTTSDPRGGVCGPLLRTLSLFMTKTCDIPYPIYDLTKNSKPYLWPGPYIKIRFQTCIVITSLLQTNVKLT